MILPTSTNAFVMMASIGALLPIFAKLTAQEWHFQTAKSAQTQLNVNAIQTSNGQLQLRSVLVNAQM
jgi:hypothetical protein